MPATTFLHGRPYNRLRGAAWLYLTSTGHVLIPTDTSDSGGGATVTWASGPTIACRVDDIGGFEEVIAERISSQSSRTRYTITVPGDAVVDVNDRFVIDGIGTFVITAAPQRTGEVVRILSAVEAT